MKDKLLRDEVITHEQWNFFLKQAFETQNSLIDVLVQTKLLPKSTLSCLLKESTGFPYIDLAEETLDLEHKDIQFLCKNTIFKTLGALPFRIDKNMHIAMEDPSHLLMRDQVTRVIQDMLNQEAVPLFYFASPQLIQSIFSSLKSSEIVKMRSNLFSSDLDSILQHAIDFEASDIHFEPGETLVTFKFRIDGVLLKGHHLSLTAWQALCNQLKIKAQLDIAQIRIPQSGHFQERFLGKILDFRVSTHPTIFGESIVIRLLDKHKELHNLSELGFYPDQIEMLRHLLSQKEGLVLLSGPTGSGKTTTLYALLSLLADSSLNIMTLEDPVEYQLPYVRQTEVSDASLSFAQGIRSILRQDPDVLLIGEIRDSETAQMAFRAALTGHLVLSTLHAFDCFSVPSRLIELGVSLSLITSYLKGVVGQRLIRKLCRTHEDTMCKRCVGTGYKGRTVVGEILLLNEEIRHFFSDNTDRYYLMKQLPHFKTMKERAKQKLKEKVTDENEVFRVLGTL